MSGHVIDVYVMDHNDTRCAVCGQPVYWVSRNEPAADLIDPARARGHWNHVDCPHTEHITESEYGAFRSSWMPISRRRLCQLCGANLPIPGRAEE